jgi:hypothetical protein
MTVGWISGFIAELAAVKGGCSIESVYAAQGCTNFNWLVSWLFFLFVSWLAGLYFDFTAWRQGVFNNNELDDNVLLDIRRQTRSNRF